MEIEILKENLQKAVSNASRFVANKPSLPVLSMILLKTSKDKILLAATNMDTGIEIEAPARVNTEGSVVVPAKVLLEYVGLLPAGNVKLLVKDGVLEIVAVNNKAKISGLLADEFPELPKIEGKDGFGLESVDLDKIVKLVSFAASSDETRPVLSAVLFKIKNNLLEVVATDGYRLSLIKKIRIDGETSDTEMLISARVIQELVRIVKEESVKTVQVILGKTQKSLVFKVGSIHLTTRIIDGDYPSYEKIVPDNQEIVLKMNCEETLEAIKTSAIFARESSNIIKWVVDDSRLIMSSNSSGVGEQESVVEVEVVQGEGGTIAFNSRFLIEFFSNTASEKVQFEMGGSLAPGLFRTDTDGFIHVIMPVRVQGN